MNKENLAQYELCTLDFNPRYMFMPLPFRSHHTTFILQNFRYDQGALDRFISSYFIHNRSIGAHDRRFITQDIYTLIRFWRLFDAVAKKKMSWDERIDFLRNNPDIIQLQNLLEKTDHRRYGIGSEYFSKIMNSFPEELAKKQLDIINTQAPLSIRTNTLKVSRSELLTSLPSHLQARPSQHTLNGIILERREKLLQLDSFLNGEFELQDEGSQMVAGLVKCSPGDHLLDYCAGSGGKTLAIAPDMKGKGQILLHDIRPTILQKAKIRMRRAGVQNVQFCLPGSKILSSKKNKMDWVLLDVPCSGSGTIRRHPEKRDAIEDMQISNYIEIQRDIFKSAICFLKPGGKIVYVTCSLFSEENEEQIDFFLKNYPVSLVEQPLKICIQKNGPDGFFAATLQKH